MLALLLAPVLFFGILAFREQAGRERVLPRFEAQDVRRVELAYGGQALVLVRAGKDAPWLIPTAANAPGDAARIEGALQRLAKLEGKPLDATAPAPTREPVTLRLSLIHI